MISYYFMHAIIWFAFWRSKISNTMAIYLCQTQFVLFLSMQEIDGLKTMMDENVEDRDMLDMVTEELDEAVKEEKRLQQLLLQSLLPRDDADERGSILEVRAGNSCILCGVSMQDSKDFRRDQLQTLLF